MRPQLLGVVTMMPKWMIALIAAAVAGAIGFACGALLPRPGQEAKPRQTQTQEDRRQTAQMDNARSPLVANTRP